jgi:ribonuclease G
MPDDSPREEILVNVTPSEVRAAVLENGVLQDVYIERAARRGLISNIYKGRVSRVLPGMQAAFVDIGLVRTAFLHASDIARPKSTYRYLISGNSFTRARKSSFRS